MNEVVAQGKSGALSERLLNDSVAKIFALKDKYHLRQVGLVRRPLTPHQIKSVKEKIALTYSASVTP